MLPFRRLLKPLKRLRALWERRYTVDQALHPVLDSLAEEQHSSPDEMVSSLVSEALSRRQVEADLVRRWQALSAREQEVAALACLGYTNRQINTYIKLLDYRSRWMDPELGRFISPDTIIPNVANPQSLNRYSYVQNRPILFNDPTGHREECDSIDRNCDGRDDDTRYYVPSHPGVDKYKGTNRCRNTGDCDEIVATGTVTTGFNFPGVENLDLGKKAEDSWDKTSADPYEYNQTTSFHNFGTGDIGVYGANAIGVAGDYLSMFAPTKPGANNVVVFVKWEYHNGYYTIPSVTLVNYTTSYAAIGGLAYPANNPSQQTVFGNSDGVGHNGLLPGVQTMKGPQQQYSRNDSVFLIIYAKVLTLPIKTITINIPGTGLVPSTSNADTGPWWTK